MGQGYVFSPAVPLEELKVLLEPRRLVGKRFETGRLPKSGRCIPEIWLILPAVNGPPAAGFKPDLQLPIPPDPGAGSRMNNVETISPGAGRRSGINPSPGKLISAFILVAALTVAATLVALYQFGNIDAVMTRLTEFSLPRVKHSLAVETNAKAIAASGVQLAAATSETQRFTRMSESTEQISKLWTNLSELRSIVGDTWRSRSCNP